MKKYKRKRRGEGSSYWQSYSDMMAALLLMFILIMSFTILHSLSSYEQQKKLLDEQQEKLEKLVGVKSDIIQDLSLEFEDTSLSISVDPQTGAIAFDSNVLFDYNQVELKSTAKEFLNEFMPLYLEVLLSESYEPYLSEIIVEGHTDDNGSYIYNLDLSQKRALSIATYFIEEGEAILDKEQLEGLREILTANGRSWSNLIYNTDGTVNDDESRRVEFKFRLKDDEMIEEMKNILEEQ
ncbi:OmpA family protein [Alloiococcus sp. CFN-8]|uniref:OmpA family protein n=1 Tax=Alloiococcus sp. CFN-8 TaxID=3416081 RepID=UPI003CF908E4